MPPGPRDSSTNERLTNHSAPLSRRTLLSAGAAALATAVAGCSELPDFSTDAGGTPALPSEPVAGDPNAAAVVTARDALLDGQSALDGFLDRLPPVYAVDDPPSRVPADRVAAGVQTARRSLDRLGNDAPSASRRTASALRGYADFQSAVVDYLQRYLPVLHDVDAYRAYRRAERYQKAGSALSSASEALDSLGPLRESATAAANDLDRDALAAVGVRLSASSVPGWMANATARKRFGSRLLDGFANEVSGLTTLRSGRDAFAAGQYSTAEERFLRAKSSFSEAESGFVGLESGTASLPGATGVAVEYACRASAMFDHCDAMAAAARSASFGQPSARERALERAHEAREHAEECVPTDG